MPLTAVLCVAAWGFYAVINRAGTIDNDTDVDDDVAILEVTGASASRLPPQRLASASITDVIPAIHQSSDDDHQPTILQAGYTTSKPASNPSVWLMGTIEDAAEPPPWPARVGASAPQRFSRFNDK